MFLQSLLVSVAGGIICLDRVFVQAMISRPIVAGPLMGFILSDPYTGLITGAFIELFWIDRLPVGTCLPPNDSVVAILAASSSIIAGQQLGAVSRELIALSVLFFLPVGYLGRKMDAFIISSNDALLLEGIEDAKRANIAALSRTHIKGLVKHFSLTSSLLFISVLAGTYVLTTAFPHLPLPVVKALDITYCLLPLLGVAVAINTINLRGTIPIFIASFLTIAVILEFVHGK
ncbi:MAG: PTS sugar transporter subunit IIC [Deltaproteobacteria bacterium]|nr:PTS sugar transporter subunit IIC [Deltaproteobacteria bacterium]